MPELSGLKIAGRVRRGLSRSETVVRALDPYPARAARAASADSLAADRIPARGAKALQSLAVRGLARKTFRGLRTRCTIPGSANGVLA